MDSSFPPKTRRKGQKKKKVKGRERRNPFFQLTCTVGERKERKEREAEREYEIDPQIQEKETAPALRRPLEWPRKGGG